MYFEQAAECLSVGEGCFSGQDFEHSMGEVGGWLRKCKSGKSKFEVKPNYYTLCKYAVTGGTGGRMLVKNTNSYRLETQNL